MKAKPKPKVPDKADDKEQSERFIDTARAHGADDKPLDEAFKALIPSKNIGKADKKRPDRS